MSFARELEKPRRGRIHDLVQEPREEKIDAASFDFDKEVGEKEWVEIEKKFFKCIDDGEWYVFAELIEHIQIIFPEKIVSLEIDKYISKLKTAVEAGGRVFKLPVLGVLRSIGVDLSTIESTDRHWGDWVINMPPIRDFLTTEWGEVIRFYYLLAEIDLTRAEKDAGISGEEWQMIVGFYNHGSIRKEPFYQAEFASRLRVLRPDLFSILNISKEDWQHWHVELESCRKRKEWIEFSKLASYMKILIASDVHMSDHGLEITMPKRNEHKETIPDRPIRQNF